MRRASRTYNSLVPVVGSHPRRSYITRRLLSYRNVQVDEKTFLMDWVTSPTSTVYSSPVSCESP